jgi:hypothetical protein
VGTWGSFLWPKYRRSTLVVKDDAAQCSYVLIGARSCGCSKMVARSIWKLQIFFRMLFVNL